MHPLEVGTRARCQREGATHACEIIERASALVEDGPEAATVRWTYYVHYDGLNRRLDEWVPGERLHVEDEVGAGGGRGVGACPLARSPSSCTDPGRRATRHMKRRHDEMHVENDVGAYDDPAEKEHQESTKVKNIQTIEIGKFEVDTWYFSPFPEEYGDQKKLYICEYTLKYMRRKKAYQRHRETCTSRSPPGTLIYRSKAPPLDPSCY